MACLHTVGVVGGTTAATYSPQRAATRAQVATMLARIWRLSGRECPADAPNPFSDVADGSGESLWPAAATGCFAPGAGTAKRRRRPGPPGAPETVRARAVASPRL